jgi:hypothetical protein
MNPLNPALFLLSFSFCSLVIDMKQNTPDILRLRTFIFPGEEQKAYVES